MTTHATRLDRLEQEQRKRKPTEAQHVFAHGPAAEAMGRGYSHAKVVAALQWSAQAYTGPEAGEMRTNGRK